MLLTDMFKQTIFLGLFLSLHWACFAQNDSITMKVQQLFPNVKLEWSKHFKGRIDDLSDIGVSLASDGKFCRGYLRYLKSNEKFLLDGTVKGDTLFLKEIDNNKSTSGHLVLLKKGKKLEGEWSNHNKTIGGIQINLAEVNEPPHIPSFCGDNKWIHVYRGIFGDNDIEILLQKGSFGALRGIGFFPNSKKSFHVKGTYDDTKLGMDLQLRDDNNHKIASLALRQKSGTELVGYFITPDGKKKYGDISRLNNLNVSCIEFADYISSYDITYPQLESETFNLWMQGLIEEWFKINLAYINSLRYDNIDNVPEVRNAARAYGWCDAEFLSLDLISGYLVFGNSWTNRQRERVFIYDIEGKKELIKEDIFKRESGVDNLIKSAIEEGLKNNILYNEQDFKDWIATQKFEDMTIRQEGIHFASTSIAYGRQGVTIPFTRLLPFLREGGAIWKLANSK
jgi:hypothetical protein